MANDKKSKKSAEQVAETESAETNDQSSEPKAKKEPQPLTTGLEDYGRWRTFYQGYQRPKNEKPFRRGRIWC